MRITCAARVQVISCGGGSVSLLFEHSFGDGAAWNRWLDPVVADMEARPHHTRPPTPKALGPPPCHPSRVLVVNIKVRYPSRALSRPGWDVLGWAVPGPCLAVQWHPERTYTESAFSRAIFAGFVQAASIWQPRKIQDSVVVG